MLNQSISREEREGTTVRAGNLRNNEKERKKTKGQLSLVPRQPAQANTLEKNNRAISEDNNDQLPKKRITRNPPAALIIVS